MDSCCAETRQKIHDFFLAFCFIVLPLDRPSPIFVFLDIFINGGLLSWSSEVFVSNDCSMKNSAWLFLGIIHTIVNMMFGIAIMFTTRQKIKKGVEMNTTYVYWLVLDPVMTAYLVYLVWEIGWMIMALWYYTGPNSNDKCRNHLNVQVVFFLAYFVIGAGSFFLTFTTEWLANPRWRVRAHYNWCLNNHQAIFPTGEIPANHTGLNNLQDSLMPGNLNGSFYYHRETLPTMGSPCMRRENQEEIVHNYFTQSETRSTAPSSIREGGAMAVLSAPHSLSLQSAASTYSRRSAGRILPPLSLSLSDQQQQGKEKK